MAEKIRSSESIERVESAENPRRLEQGNVEQRVRSTLEQMRLEKGLTPERAFRELTEGLSGWLAERFEDVGKTIEFAQKAISSSEFGKSEFGKKILGGLEAAQKWCESGAEDLRSEKGQAVVALIGLAFLSMLSPLGPAELLSAHPELLVQALTTIVG
jgi:hypothetical protein